jgi:hypothetical protein
MEMEKLYYGTQPTSTLSKSLLQLSALDGDPLGVHYTSAGRWSRMRERASGRREMEDKISHRWHAKAGASAEVHDGTGKVETVVRGRKSCDGRESHVWIDGKAAHGPYAKQG